MFLSGSRGQLERDLMHRADGSITTGGAAQLVLCERPSTSFIDIQNIAITSSVPLYFEFGSARAHAVLTGAVVTSAVVDNAGFNFTNPPVVHPYGGGNAFWDGSTQGGGLGQNVVNSILKPTRPAKFLCVMASATPLPGLKVASITVLDGGAGYTKAPELFLMNSVQPFDPYGVADPSINSGSGKLIYPGQGFTWNGTFCPTDQIAVYGSHTGDPWTLMWKE